MRWVRGRPLFMNGGSRLGPVKRVSAPSTRMSVCRATGDVRPTGRRSAPGAPIETGPFTICLRPSPFNARARVR